MVGALFRRADRTRSDRLLGQARMLKDTARFHARLGRLLVDARAAGRDAFRAIDDWVGWDQLERSIRFAEDLTRSADDGLEEVIERYPAVRRFDTAGAVDHVFGLCHLLGFRFAPRIRDLNERRIYGLSSLDTAPARRRPGQHSGDRGAASANCATAHSKISDIALPG